MKVIILAGGRGTRLSEYTGSIPKPMVTIKNKPIVHHIIDIYNKFGFEDFIIATGYKSNLLTNYIETNKNLQSYSINCVYTGLNTMTGGRVLKLKKYLNDNEDFLLTYGDGVANVDLNKLIRFHKKNDALLTVTAVRPPARFGYLKIARDNHVKTFTEKKQINEGWINGGFFVCKKEILKYIKDNQTYFEREPMTQVSKIKKLYAFKHKGFWQCMDTVRDKEFLDSVLPKNNILPWLDFDKKN